MRFCTTKVLVAGLLIASMFSGCKVLLPFEKEYLLSPLMDDQALSGFQSDFAELGFGNVEKLSSQGGSSQSGACPTCGG